MESLFEDLRYAVRQLAKSPGFTAVTVITLSLGIGATSAVYSLANWLVLRPLPGTSAPGDLVSVYVQSSRGSPWLVSYLNHASLSERVRQLSAIAGELRGPLLTVGPPGGAPTRRQVSFITANYFDVLGVPLLLGRRFTAAEEAASERTPVVIISYALWTTVFGRDPGAVGRPLRLNALEATVAGVTPRSFRGTSRATDTDVWLPGSSLPAVMGFPSPSILSDRQHGVFQEMIGRLSPGSSPAEAEAELGTIIGRLAEEFPAENAFLREVKPMVRAGVGIRLLARDRVEQTLWMLGAVAAVLLLIAAANAANLMLFRNARRRAELGVRQALGASRARLVGHGAAEGMVLSLVGAVAGILLAVWLQSAFRGMTLPGLVPIEDVPLDARVLMFGVVLSVAAGVLTCLVPVAAAVTPTAALLKESAVRGTGRHAPLRDGLAVLQLSASFALLVGALLFVNTLRNLRDVDVGFDARHVTALSVDPRSMGYSAESFAGTLGELMPRLGRVPGVDGAAVTNLAPFGGVSLGNRVWTTGDSTSGGEAVTEAWVSSAYFKTLGIAFTSGGTLPDIASSSPDAEALAVVSRSLARALFGPTDPVGLYVRQRARPRAPGQAAYRLIRVVGVAQDSRWASVTGNSAGPMMYHPLGERSASGSGSVTFLVHSTLPASQLRPALTAAVADVAPGLPVFDVGTLGERVERTLSEQRLLARMVTLLCVLAVVLATVGLYGLVAFDVAERTKEFGIRIALGAQATEILDLVVRRGAVLVGIGLAIGIGGAVGLSRLVANRLFGVTPLEPYVYILAAAVLVVVALAASIIPARVATKADPMIALRSE